MQKHTPPVDPSRVTVRLSLGSYATWDGLVHLISLQSAGTSKKHISFRVASQNEQHTIIDEPFPSALKNVDAVIPLYVNSIFFAVVGKLPSIRTCLFA